MSKVWKFFGLLGGTILLLLILGGTGLLKFSPSQILSIGIFSMFIYGTLLFGDFRLAFAFGGIALLMMCNLLTVERFTQSASLDVLVFLIGTFLVIGYLEECRFFERIVEKIVAMVGPRPEMLLLVLMILASVASALVGEVTAILFMAGAMLHLTSKYKLNPVPFVIMLVFACNNGSAMSSVGNPIGVLIALKTGLSFVDFVKWAAPVAIVVDIATYAICRWWFADSFTEFAHAVQAEFVEQREAQLERTRPALAVVGGGDAAQGPLEDIADLPPEYVPKNTLVMDPDAMRAYRNSWLVLFGLILMLVTHKQVEGWLGLREGTMMVVAALTMGSVVLFLQREKARELVERRVDWWTLSFFMMLFASVGTLQDTKVTDVIAQRMSGIGGGQMPIIQSIGWATGWLSAFLDNVLAVATFMPVVHDIRAHAGAPFSSAIYWFMLFGGTFMGNMTVIGSTANIVAVGLLQRRGHGTIGFGYWMKIGFIVSIASMIVATLLLLLQWHWLPMMPVPGPELPAGG